MGRIGSDSLLLITQFILQWTSQEGGGDIHLRRAHIEASFPKTFKGWSQIRVKIFYLYNVKIRGREGVLGSSLVKIAILK